MLLLAPAENRVEPGDRVDLGELPPARLAGLLVDKRRRAGFDLAQVSRLSQGRFTPSELERYERGFGEFDAAAVSGLVQLYRFDSAEVVPKRNQLELDLDNQQLRVGAESVAFADDSLILTRYVELLRKLRNQPTARQMTLRDADLSVLSGSLGRDAETLRAELYELMGDSEPERNANWVKMIGAVGAAVVAGTAAVGVGAVVVDAFDRNGTPDPAAELTRPDAPRAAAPAAGFQVTLASAQQPTAPAVAVIADRQAEILATVPWDFTEALVGWTIEFDDSSAQWHGLTNSMTRTITVFDRAEMSPTETAEILAHELGHAIDLEFLDDDLRMQWLELRGMPMVWWADDGQPDFAVGAGDFAEAVATILTGSASDAGFGDFTPDQLAFVADLIPGWA